VNLNNKRQGQTNEDDLHRAQLPICLKDSKKQSMNKDVAALD